jgi:hypothetical protein
VRFVVGVTSAREGWEVEVRGLLPAQLPRRMDRLEDSGFPKPLDPADDRARVDELFTRIASGRPAAGQVARFGRYLFDALLGKDLWEAVLKQAAGDLIELALDLPDTDLQRLPWEAMHSGNTFLAAEPGRLVAVTRLVNGPPALRNPAQAPRIRARVLFVVGASLKDPNLRPGAEYLGLLRRLEASGLGLSSHLLLEATAEDLEAAVKEFRPSVVHFIGHGEFSGGKPVLKLVDKDNTARFKDLDAEGLYGLLTPPGLKPEEHPAAVVLNACYSAKAFGGPAGILPEERRTRTFAAVLVEMGIPLVIGMGGRVADPACRIFTQWFYKTLLKGDPIQALAQARRAGHGQGTAPGDTIDWALTVLFRDPSVALAIGPDAEVRSRVQRATGRLLDDLKRRPEAFCDRLPCLADHQELLASPGIERPRRPRRVMAIYEDFEPSHKAMNKYGRTWLLQQIAIHAIQNGHIPCLLKVREGDIRVETLIELANRVRIQSLETRKLFGVPRPPSFEILKLHGVQQGAPLPEPLHPDLDTIVKLEGARAHESVRCALRLDLVRLREDVRSSLFLADGAGESADLDPQVLVLFDDLHSLVAPSLIEDVLDSRFLDAAGFGEEADPIPVVVSFCRTTLENTRMHQALLDFAAKRAVIDHSLAPFEPPASDRFPYEQYLLQRDPPLIPNATQEKEADVNSAFKRIHSLVKGIPSQLDQDRIEALVGFAVDVRTFHEAKDEDYLNRLREGGLL